MALSDKIRSGSFRGVVFDTFSWTRKRVKKNTEHQYANSDRRYIEERGVQEPDFSVTLSIFGTDDYIDKRDALRKALEEEGEGLLVLPLEGEFNVKCTDFDDTQNIVDTLGRCDFNVTFKVISQNEDSGNPVEVNNSKILLADTTKSLRETVAEMVNQNILVTNAVSYTNCVDKLSSFADNMRNIANNIGNSSFSDLLSNFTTSIPSFLGGNIALLGSAINTLFYTFESVSDTASNLLSSSETLFGFGDTDLKVSPSTPERAEQIKNDQILNTQINASVVGSASNAFADNEFSNEEDLKDAQEKIEDQIENILNSDALKNSDIEGIEEVKYYLKQLQVDFSQVVAEKEITTPKIKTISVKNESVSLIAYKYYNNLDNVDALIELNNIQRPQNVNGEIKVLTDV